MNSITVDKKELLAIIMKNRDEHREIFEEAFAGYRKRVEEELSKMLDDCKAGRSFSVAVQAPAPADHTSQYNRVIKMLEMDQASQVELEEHDFASYVMNEWQWMHQAMVSNSRYSMKAAAYLAKESH